MRAADSVRWNEWQRLQGGDIVRHEHPERPSEARFPVRLHRESGGSCLRYLSIIRWCGMANILGLKSRMKICIYIYIYLPIHNISYDL